jgi:hypothetical protein
MKRTNQRDLRPKKPRSDGDPQRESVPPRPEFLHMDDRHLIWRATQRPAPGKPMRLITWDIRIGENEVAVRSDLDHEGTMRDFDFREVRGLLNEVLQPVELATTLSSQHKERIRRSLYWQRCPDDDCCHMPPPKFDEREGWLFAIMSVPGIRQNYSLDGPVLRPASNAVALDRREERQWAAYAGRGLQWARNLGYDSDLGEAVCLIGHACRLRLRHYWRVSECRQLFASSKPFTALLCTPGLLPELDDPNDPDWRQTVTRLARLPRREWLARIGLPPTRQAVRLFSRLAVRHVAHDLPLIREAFSNPLTLKRLSDTTCRIDDLMLRLFLEPELPIRWSLARSMCQERGKPHSPFLRDYHLAPDWSKDDVVGQRIRRNYLRARNEQDLRKLDRFCYRLKMHDAICSPGIEQGLPGILPPLPEQPGIRLLCSVREILNIALTSGLRLEQYIQRIAAGRYALYEITHHDEQAVAGTRRTDDGAWQIDDIRGERNAKPSEEMRAHFLQWLPRETTHERSQRNGQAP